MNGDPQSKCLNSSHKFEIHAEAGDSLGIGRSILITRESLKFSGGKARILKS